MLPATVRRLFYRLYILPLEFKVNAIVLSRGAQKNKMCVHYLWAALHCASVEGTNMQKRSRAKTIQH
eukprot:5437362-Amphidinium_carterae.2